MCHVLADSRLHTGVDPVNTAGIEVFGPPGRGYGLLIVDGIPQANYYGASQQTLTGPATVLATVFTNFGRADEDRQTLTVRVTDVKDVIDVGEVKLRSP